MRAQAKQAAKTKKVGVAAGVVATAAVLIGMAFYLTRRPGNSGAKTAGGLPSWCTGLELLILKGVP